MGFSLSLSGFGFERNSSYMWVVFLLDLNGVSLEIDGFVMNVED